MDIVCEDHVTKSIYLQNEKSYCFTLGKISYDLRNAQKTFRMIGTVEQISDLCCDMLDKGVQWQDYYEVPLKEKHLDLYKKNNNEVVILNLIEWK